MVGLDDCEEVSGLGAEEEDHESGAGAVGGIHFQPHRLSVIADAGHELHIALAGDVEAASGAIYGRSFTLAAKRPFDRVQDVLHSQELYDFGFPDEQCHY